MMKNETKVATPKNRVANVIADVREEPREQAQVQTEERTITVRVGKLPGKIEDITLNGARSVQDALEGASLNASGYEVRVNGEPAGNGRALKDGDSVFLVRTIEGN